MNVLKFFFIELFMMAISLLLPSYLHFDSSLLNNLLFPGLLVVAFVVAVIRFIFRESGI